VIGAVIYLVVDAIIENLPSYYGYLHHLMAFVGGMITGRLIKSRPIISLILVGTLMGITAGVTNYLSWLFGIPVDYKGFQVVIAFAIPVFVSLASFGGAIGFREES
jgi:hypothetical protein